MTVPPNLDAASATAYVAALIVAAWFLRIVYNSFASPLRHLPGPWYTRFTHLRLKWAVITGQRIFYIHDLHRVYGSVVRLSPFEVAVADVESFQQIHRVGSDFLKSVWYQKMANLPKLGVFTITDPKEYGPRRRLLSRPFGRTHLMQHWDPIIKEQAALCVEKIKREALQGKADVFNWWMLLASDLSAHVAFGESFRMLETGEETQFIRVLKKLTMGAGISVELPIFRLLRYIPVAAVQEMFNANEYILQNSARAVEIARSQHTEANIFAKVIEDSEKGEGHVDDLDVQMDAINIIIAGTDTTAVTLTYLTWAVLQRPELQKALEDEVQTLKDDFTEADVQGLPLLNATIEEALRLYGAAPGSLPRVVPPGGATLSGWFIPEGYTVSTQAYTLHRDPTIWRDPLTFDPTRWLPSKAISPWAKTAFHPFGAGARSCLGIHLARMELRYAAALFFRKCRGARICESTTPESMEFVNFFLIAPKGHKCEITMK